MKSRFFESFPPIFKFLKKYKIEVMLLGIAGICTIIALFIFAVSSSQITDEDIVEPVREPIVNSRIMVDIGGAVNKPDLYEVATGTRFKRIIELAGGFTDEAHTEYIVRNFNLARIVSDQEKIYIPNRDEIINGIIVENQRSYDYVSPSYNTVSLANQTYIDPESEQSIPVNINIASLEELDTLPGIGAVTAQKIIQNRPYRSIQELIDKKVVKKNVFEQIKNLISV